MQNTYGGDVFGIRWPMLNAMDDSNIIQVYISNGGCNNVRYNERTTVNVRRLLLTRQQPLSIAYHRGHGGTIGRQRRRHDTFRPATGASAAYYSGRDALVA